MEEDERGAGVPMKGNLVEPEEDPEQELLRCTGEVVSFGCIAGLGHATYWNTLWDMPHLPTKFMDASVLKKMGIHNDVVWLFKGMGLSKLLRMSEPAYKEPTVDFLASAKLKIPHDINKGLLTFKIKREEYSITVEEINNIFGFSKEGSRHSFSKSRPHKEVWATIGDPAYFGGRVRATTIRHPAIRYAQKFLASTLFWRHETNVLISEEYHLLLAPFVHDQPVNLGAALAKHLVNIRYLRMESKATTRHFNLAVGGIVTALLQGGDIDLSSYSPIEGTDTLTLETLRLASLVKGVDKETEKVIYPIRVSSQVQGNILLPSKSLKPLKKVGPNFIPSTDELYTDDQLKIGKKKKKVEVVEEIQEEEGNEPRVHPSTGLPILPDTLRTPNEKWLYKNLVKVNKKNEELKKKVKKHGKAISTLMKIVRGLTPKAFRSRTTNPGEQSFDDVDDIDKFIGDYVGEDQEMADEEDPYDEFPNQSPIRHSFHIGDSSTQLSPPQETSRRHSIHEAPIFTTEQVGEDHESHVHQGRNLFTAKFSRHKWRTCQFSPSQ